MAEDSTDTEQSQPTEQELQADIEATRQELGETVEALAHKADVKARAEGLGIPCNVGLAERAERLIVVLVGIGLDGLGVPFVLAVCLWVLVVVSAYTVWQRLREVFRVSNAEITPPES